MPENDRNRVPAASHRGREQNLRLEVRAMFRLSVLAIGRREWTKSARLKAGMGDVEEGVGCDAMEPADDLRVLSRLVLVDSRKRVESTATKRQNVRIDIPLCALSLRSIPPGILLFMPPSSLPTAPLSLRLLVNTFKHTLRGGISSARVV